MKDLPVYEMIVNEEEVGSGFNFVALVDKPAIMSNWMAFSDKQVKFNVNLERRIITGPILIADLPIYRRDEMGQEYYVVFRQPEIEKMVVKFSKNGYNNNVNLMHIPQLKVEGVTMFEMFIVDSKRGILPPSGFPDYPDGSVFASYKIDNQEVLDKIQAGEVLGFSVEGYFDMKPVGNANESDLISEIENILNN